MDSLALPTRTPYMMTSLPGARFSVTNLCLAGTSDARTNSRPEKLTRSPFRRSCNAISTLSRGSSLRTVLRAGVWIEWFELMYVVYFSHCALVLRIARPRSECQANDLWFIFSGSHCFLLHVVHINI